MKFKEINIKDGMPTVSTALNNLKEIITNLKMNKYECILVIHGYGSTGKGGAICLKVRQWLKAQERKGAVKTVIFGEDFNIFNFKALELKNKYKELETLTKVCNNGVTVVEL